MSRRPNAAERAGYLRERYEAVGIAHDVYRGGEGPAVILLHELPSISWRTVKLASHIRDRGFRVVMPALVGGVRDEPTTPIRKAKLGATFVTSTLRLCISWQFVALLQRRTSPITGWLLALAREEARLSGRPRVGVIGMCLTGGFALGMAIDPVVGVAVSSQPSLPFAMKAFGKIPRQVTDPGVSLADYARLIARRQDPDFCVRAFRYTTDKIAPVERVERLARDLAPGLIFTPIQAKVPAHSVLTDAVDSGPDPTAKPAIDAALESVMTALAERL
jgi:dienelactone hydrolase